MVFYTFGNQTRGSVMSQMTIPVIHCLCNIFTDPVPDYVPKIISAKREYLALVGEDVSIDCVFESS